MLLGITTKGALLHGLVLFLGALKVLQKMGDAISSVVKEKLILPQDIFSISLLSQGNPGELIRAKVLEPCVMLCLLLYYRSFCEQLKLML